MRIHSLCTLFLAGAAAAQATHTQLFPAVSPSARAGLHGVTDGTAMLVFGGLTSGSPLAFSNEMWRFDGINWTNLTPSQSPPARDWYASAFDAGRQRYVLFGGRVLSGTTGVDAGDTWEFDGTTWTQLTPALSPSARRWSSMVYDPVLGRCILFGGSTGGTVFLNDTWSWDGTNWTQLAPATSPSPRARGWLEWDSHRNRAIYFGGKNTTASTALAETWSWDSSTWTLVPTATLPGWNAGTGLIAYGMTFDPIRDRMVLVGGTRTTATVSPQTWELTPTDWVLHNTGGLPGRTAAAVAFVPAAGKTFVFGGSAGAPPLGDTYEYQTNAWPGYVPFGNGCAGSAGVVAIGQTKPAWLGESHETVVTGLAPTSLCFVALGFSNTTWAGGSLPFPLQFVYGQTAANCQLLTSADATSVLTNVGGTATFTLPLPNALNLLGLQVHLQAAQLELDATLSVSGGATMTLGAK